MLSRGWVECGGLWKLWVRLSHCDPPQRINLRTADTQRAWCHGNFQNEGAVGDRVWERKNVCVFDLRSLGSESSEAESLELSADLVPKVTIGSVYRREAVCVCVWQIQQGKTFSREHKDCMHMCEHTNCHIYTDANNKTHAHTHTHPAVCCLSARNEFSPTDGEMRGNEKHYNKQHLLPVTYCPDRQTYMQIERDRQLYR